MMVVGGNFKETERIISSCQRSRPAAQHLHRRSRQRSDDSIAHVRRDRHHARLSRLMPPDSNNGQRKTASQLAWSA
jgi:hypothetical protein